VKLYAITMKFAEQKKSKRQTPMQGSSDNK